jgi:hypothetical protein
VLYLVNYIWKMINFLIITFWVFQIFPNQQAVSMGQVIEHLPGKWKALSSTPSTTKKKKSQNQTFFLWYWELNPEPHACYHLNHAPMTLLFCFWDRIALCIPGWPQTHHSPASAYQVAEIIGEPHHTQLQIKLFLTNGLNVLETLSLWYVHPHTHIHRYTHHTD